MSGLYPNGTNTTMDLTSDPGAAFSPEGPGTSPAQFDQIYAQAAGEVAKINAQRKQSFDGVIAPEWLSKATLQQHQGQPIDPKPIAQPALVIARQDMSGVGMWTKQVLGDPVSVCPDLPAPTPNAASGSIAATVSGQLSYDQQFNQLRGQMAAGFANVLAAIKAAAKPVAMLLLCLLLASTAVHAQVRLKFTPEPMAVPGAVMAGARDMGRWLIEGCNDGTAPVTMTTERLSMASPIAWIDEGDAVLVLTGHQKRSPASVVLKVLQYAAQGAAIGLAVASRSNYAWSTGLSIGSGVLPQVVQIVQGEVPSVTPLLSGVKYPVTLAPGACWTDHRFAAKVRKPAVLTAEVK